MKRIFVLTSVLAGVLLSSVALNAQGGITTDQLPFDNDYCFGLDMSFVKRAEDRGQVFYDTDGTAKSPWEMFRSHGYNWGRLMICSEPSYLGQGIDNVVKGAKELRGYGYRFLLDYMFSDNWSNPMLQPVPESWKGLDPDELEKAVYDFVYSTMTKLKEEGVLPDMVQIGNEVSNGMLWPHGRVFYGKEKKHRSQWARFTDYLKAGIKAVRDIDEDIEIMIHADFGGDVAFSDEFFTNLKKYKVDYDVIGFSHYPWSHGTLMDLRDNLAFVTGRFGKPVIVVETGYYSEPSDYFEKKGVYGAFPETPEGQMQWFQAVNEVVMDVDGNMGLGVFWWEPMYRGRGFFDDNTHVVKPIVDAFRKYAYPLHRYDGNPRIWDFEEGEEIKP